MTLSSNAFNKFKSSSLISWKPYLSWTVKTGKLQHTVAGCIEKTGVGLHSGKVSTVKIWPDVAGKGRRFDFRSNLIPASIYFAENSPLCTTLAKDGYRISTVEHLLSALEATGVDNCRIQIDNLDGEDQNVEVPIFDGSAQEWVEAVDKVGLKVATDIDGNTCEKMVPHLTEPVQILSKDSFVAAFPSPKVHLSCGIDFSEVPAIGCQWFSSSLIDDSIYKIQIAPSRTFCIYEEVEKMQNAGLIKGGSMENALVCSKSGGWLNPPLRFDMEPCHHKVLDLIGDLSLYARFGSQGIPMAHIVAFKSGHALHADFLRLLA